MCVAGVLIALESPPGSAIFFLQPISFFAFSPESKIEEEEEKTIASWVSLVVPCNCYRVRQVGFAFSPARNPSVLGAEKREKERERKKNRMRALSQRRAKHLF